MEDAEKWTQFRGILGDQVEAAREFQSIYSDVGYDGEADDMALEDLKRTIGNFDKTVNDRITHLDSESQSLIQIVSILISPTHHTSLLYAVQRHHLRPRLSADMVIGI